MSWRYKGDYLYASVDILFYIMFYIMFDLNLPPSLQSIICSYAPDHWWDL